MKKGFISLFCILIFATGYAAGSKNEDKHKEDAKVTLDIHTDQKGNVHINTTVKNEKEIEALINKCLSDLSVRIDDGGDKKKSKKVELSLTIKEK